MRKFGLDVGAYVAVFVGAPFTTAVMWVAAFVVPHEGSGPLLYGTCAVGVAVSWYGTIRFVRECPRRFEVSDARLTAIWFGGRTGSWELQELLVPDALKLLLKDISVTDVSVVDRNGHRAFKIFIRDSGMAGTGRSPFRRLRSCRHPCRQRSGPASGREICCRTGATGSNDADEDG